MWAWEILPKDELYGACLYAAQTANPFGEGQEDSEEQHIEKRNQGTIPFSGCKVGILRV